MFFPRFLISLSITLAIIIARLLLRPPAVVLLREIPMEEYLVDPHILFPLPPKLLLVRQDAPSDFSSRLLHIHTIGSTCARLHRTCTFRLRLLRILVHESIEEVRKRVEVEICA